LTPCPTAAEPIAAFRQATEAHRSERVQTEPSKIESVRPWTSACQRPMEASARLRPRSNASSKCAVAATGAISRTGSANRAICVPVNVIGRRASLAHDASTTM